MKKLGRLYATVLGVCLCLMPAIAFGAGGGAAPIVIVSDTRKLTGVIKWWGNVYNESHMEFTILTVILIPTVGCLFGFIADIVMGGIGIDLKKRQLAEH